MLTPISTPPPKGLEMLLNDRVEYLVWTRSLCILALQKIMLSEINLTKKDKYFIISHMWNFKMLNSYKHSKKAWRDGSAIMNSYCPC